MTPENRRRNVEDELRLSEESWRAGETLLGASSFRKAISCFYYAAFHAARAALLSHGVEPKTHAGVRFDFHQRFVRPGRVRHEEALALTSLQKEREEADYARELAFVREDAEEARDDAARLRSVILAVLREDGFSG